MLLFLPLLAQAAVAGSPLPTVDDDRLRLCLTQATSDPTTALAEADGWLAGARGAARSKPLQCLGQVYTVLLRWPAAEQAFAESAAAIGNGDARRSAALLAQAGNAALAGGRAEAALAHFDRALASAAGTEATARGLIQLDRARALVALNRPGEAREALTAAQRDAPDQALVWLLSATLSRREGDLAAAQRQIEVAASLDPKDAEVGLEAGAIAMLDGREAAARQSWQSVLLTAPASKAAETAKAYLAQLAPASAPGAGAEAAGR